MASTYKQKRLLVGGSITFSWSPGHMWTEPNNIFGEIVIVAQFENVIYRKHRTPLNIREDCKSKEGDQHYVILSFFQLLLL